MSVIFKPVLVGTPCETVDAYLVIEMQ